MAALSALLSGIAIAIAMLATASIFITSSGAGIDFAGELVPQAVLTGSLVVLAVLLAADVLLLAILFATAHRIKYYPWWQLSLFLIAAGEFVIFFLAVSSIPWLSPCGCGG